ncbi:hypothetical protein GCM10009789_50090 [Kribbella sancticallisti]|uniref:Uncharacterized protein n=1 Tax=Kribbella sancticallisti TaxID=460087 RepID=A0ABP4PYD9_9ACTN
MSEPLTFSFFVAQRTNSANGFDSDTVRGMPELWTYLNEATWHAGPTPTDLAGSDSAAEAHAPDELRQIYSAWSEADDRSPGSPSTNATMPSSAKSSSTTSIRAVAGAASGFG